MEDAVMADTATADVMAVMEVTVMAAVDTTVKLQHSCIYPYPNNHKTTCQLPR